MLKLVCALSALVSVSCLRGTQTQFGQSEKRSAQVHLLAFGDGPCAGSAKRFKAEAEAAAIFDNIHIYTELPADITADARWKRHLEAKRAEQSKWDSSRTALAAFWFWKPALVQKHLQTMAAGDVLIYTDTGCELGNASAWGDLFGPLCEHDLVGFQLNHSERAYTKSDIFGRFGIGASKHMPYDLGQVCGTYFLLKKSESSEQFVSKWVDLVSDFHLVSDEPSNHPEDPSFVDSRHDQSLFSMLLKANSPKLEAMPDKSWELHKEFGIKGFRPLVLNDIGYPANPSRYPFAASRSRGSSRTSKASTLQACDASCRNNNRELLSRCAGTRMPTEIE